MWRRGDENDSMSRYWDDIDVDILDKIGINQQKLDPVFTYKRYNDIFETKTSNDFERRLFPNLKFGYNQRQIRVGIREVI